MVEPRIARGAWALVAPAAVVMKKLVADLSLDIQVLKDINSRKC